MKKFLFPILLISLFLTACNQEPTTEDPATTEPTTANGNNANAGSGVNTNQQPPSTSGGSDSIGVYTAGAGGMAPVTGSDSVAGGGSGVGTAAKSKAKDVAGSMGSSSLDQMSGE